MKYKNKKKVLACVKVGLIASAFLMLASPYELIARISGGIAVFLFFTHMYVRHLMRRHFQKEVKIDDEPEYLFEWLVISWVGTLFGLFVPGFLYVQNFISIKAFHRVLIGEFAFLVLYSVFAGLRSYRYRKSFIDADKQRVRPDTKPVKKKD
jgi:hypothetical protein